MAMFDDTLGRLINPNFALATCLKETQKLWVEGKTISLREAATQVCGEGNPVIPLLIVLILHGGAEVTEFCDQVFKRD